MALAGVENAVRYKENKWRGNYLALFAQLLVACNMVSSAASVGKLDIEYRLLNGSSMHVQCTKRRNSSH